MSYKYKTFDTHCIGYGTSVSLLSATYLNAYVYLGDFLFRGTYSSYILLFELILYIFLKKHLTHDCSFNVTGIPQLTNFQNTIRMIVPLMLHGYHN